MSERELRAALERIGAGVPDLDPWRRLARVVDRTGRLPQPLTHAWLLPRLRSVWARHPEARALTPLFLRAFAWAPCPGTRKGPGKWWRKPTRSKVQGFQRFDLVTGLPLWVRVRSMGMELCWIPPGRFQMGPPVGPAEYRWGSPSPAIEVELDEGFWMGRFPVTQAEYRAVTGGNPSQRRGRRLPVESLTWRQAVRFCQRLTAQERERGFPADWEYRLPSEAEWEYACRGGTAREPRDPASVGWLSGTSEGETRPVGTKPPNGFGLHDTLGNVEEWCLDVFVTDHRGAVPDGRARLDPENPRRVLRGGSCRTAVGLAGPRYRDAAREDSSGARAGVWGQLRGLRCVVAPVTDWATEAARIRDVRTLDDELLDFAEMFDP